MNIYNYDSRNAFYRFYRDFKKFIRMPLGSKYDEINDFYTLWTIFICPNSLKYMKQSSTETKKNIKIEFWIMAINFTMIILNFTEEVTTVQM